MTTRACCDVCGAPGPLHWVNRYIPSQQMHLCERHDAVHEKAMRHADYVRAAEIDDSRKKMAELFAKQSKILAAAGAEITEVLEAPGRRRKLPVKPQGEVG